MVAGADTMGDVVQFVWRLFPDWLADRVGGLFRMPFLDVLTWTVVLTLSLVIFFAAPGGVRRKSRLLVALGAIAIAAIELARPLGWSLPWG
jgi:hypothetical protein